MNHGEEAFAGLRVDVVGLLAQGFGIADQRRQRRAQLVTGIGDEIHAHLLGRTSFAAVDEADQQRAVLKGRDPHQPVPARAAEAGQLDFLAATFARPFQRLESGRMAYRPVEFRSGKVGAE